MKSYSIWFVSFNEDREKRLPLEEFAILGLNQNIFHRFNQLDTFF